MFVVIKSYHDKRHSPEILYNLFINTYEIMIKTQFFIYAFFKSNIIKKIYNK